MKVVMKGAVFCFLLEWLWMALPLAQTPETTPRDSRMRRELLRLPQIHKGNHGSRWLDETPNRDRDPARCPRGATCADNEPVKIRFHWVCPGSEDITSKYICKEASFDFLLSVNGNASFNPEDSQLPGNNSASVAPCPSGYLIGWVVDPKTARPIKYDGLIGRAVLRDSRGATEGYEAIAIQADPNLATRADIATEIDPRSGTPALVFDGGAGHYQAVARRIPATSSYPEIARPALARARRFADLADPRCAIEPAKLSDFHRPRFPQ